MTIKFSEIRARRARPYMEMVRTPPRARGWKGKLTEETDTIYGLFRLPAADPNQKEYPVILFTERFPDGLHFGPGEKIKVVKTS